MWHNKVDASLVSEAFLSGLRKGGIYVLSLFLYFIIASGYSSYAVAADSVWKEVSASQVKIKLAKPKRNWRSKDVSADISLENISGAEITGPLRLIIGGFGPTTKISIGNATGQTIAGEPYYDLTNIIGINFAESGSGVVNVIVKGVGSFGLLHATAKGRHPKNFNFAPRIERQVPQIQPLTINITSPATLLTVGSTPQTVKGTVSDPQAQVILNGNPVTNDNGRFQADVALDEGHNTITARAVNAKGEDVTDIISLSLDMTPPYLTVAAPKDGDTVRTDKIAVSGLINDIVRGTVAEGHASVKVNGTIASVSNRSYLAENIALNAGDNIINIDASDNVGNTASLNIKVKYQPLAPQHIELLSGQNQSAKIGTVLNQQLKVKLLNTEGKPVADKPVIYRVVEGDGAVGAGNPVQGQGVLVRTDAEGVAATSFKLGSRAGAGNQLVRAASVGFDGEVLFYASATVGTGNKVTVNAGNNQRGAVGQPLPQPFVVAVVDEGANVVPGAQIEFKVTQGSGKFQNGQTSIISTTDSDGRATAELTLGEEEGLDVQRATATLIGTPLYAGFTASALKIGEPGQTRISGVVLDNQDQPLPGVTVRVDGTTREAQTDAQGQFKITEAPVGSVHLIADGSTTSAEGEWPALAFNLVTIAGADNPLSAPIYLVKLDTINAQTVGDKDVTLTLPEVPGFALDVKAGSVTFPDGKKTGKLSVTPVNASKIPMSPPNGMQPQFIVTIQPVGAKFDPPARLSLPNVDGHKPGAQVEMYSYDHDLEEFVAIGLGTVSTDGSIIKSNQGVGVIKAGWHCGSQPGGSGCAATPGECQKCDGNCVIVPDPTKNDQCCGGGPSVCNAGACTPVKLDSADGKVNGKEEDIVAFKTEGVPVNFTGTATGSNCDYEYSWDFGDGQTDQTQNPTHIYAKPGEYTATLKIKCKSCGPGEKSDLVKVTVVGIDIVQDGELITDTNHDEVVGKKIKLKAEVKPANLVLSDHNWTIPGKMVANYVAGSDAATITPVSAFNTQGIAYYWIDGGDSREVVYAGSVNGLNISAKASFNVKRPEAKVTTTTGSVCVGSETGRLEIHYGDNNIKPGIQFTRTVSIPGGFSGDLQWVQVIDSTLHRFQTDTKWQRISAAVVLDTEYPYTRDEFSSDSPGETLDPDDIKVTVDEKFTMWLQFKPAGSDSIPVSLRKVSWSWSGEATKDSKGGATCKSAGGWSLTSESHDVNPADSDTTDLPLWNGNITSFLDVITE